MKKTGMAKSDAKKLMGKMVAPGAAGFGAASPGKVAEVVDKREQRKRDQALGLVPFAVKLNSELVLQLNARAKERGVELNALVGELLSKGLSMPTQ